MSTRGFGIEILLYRYNVEHAKVTCSLLFTFITYKL